MDKTKTLKCPKCGGEMEKGLIPDRAENFVIIGTQIWAKKIRWGGFGTDGNTKIDVYRCQSCGFLESYAP